MSRSPRPAGRNHDPEEIAAAGLLDPAFYIRANPDIAAAGVDPAVHFATQGWREDRDPNALFDHVFYRAAHGARLSRLAPVLHYLRHGDREGLAPGPLFDPSWYRAEHGATAGTALAAWLRRADRAAVLPGPDLYGAAAALRVIGGTEEGAADPYTAYAVACRARRSIAPAPHALLAESGLFDANHYLLSQPDVAAAGGDALWHFCGAGWQEGRSPNPYFDLTFYCDQETTLQARGINPLAHYFVEGEAAGRRPILFFDPVWYRTRFALPPGANALAHFLAHRGGWQVSPNRHFDPGFFVRTYPRLTRPGRDPFMAFLVHSLARDLDPSAAFPSAAYRARNMPPGTRPDVPLLHALANGI